MGLKVAINGFGRIGKIFLRVLLQDTNAEKNIKICAINLGPSSPEDLDTFFKYDSIYGEYKENITYKNNKLVIGKHEIEIFTETDPTKLPWNKLDIDWVVEASGKFANRDGAQLHLDAGSKNVLITAPSKDEDVTIIPGVNDDSYDKEKHKIVSMGSCTTNCFAPIVKVIKENFELTHGLMTTIHAYTNNQALLDSEHKDPRRGRAAAINIVPTSTGADRVITKIYPELSGKLQGVALRVPVANGSIIDFTFNTTQKLTKESINQAFEKAANNVLFFCKKPLVSSDFIGSPYSCSIDSLMTMATGTMGKVFGWYDNEFGYCSRLKDFLLHNC